MNQFTKSIQKTHSSRKGGPITVHAPVPLILKCDDLARSAGCSRSALLRILVQENLTRLVADLEERCSFD